MRGAYEQIGLFLIIYDVFNPEQNLKKIMAVVFDTALLIISNNKPKALSFSWYAYLALSFD